jgi:hypothetical protein
MTATLQETFATTATAKELSDDELADVMEIYPRYCRALEREKERVKGEDLPDSVFLFREFVKEKGYSWSEDYTFRLLLDLINSNR